MDLEIIKIMKDNCTKYYNITDRTFYKCLDCFISNIKDKYKKRLTKKSITKDDDTDDNETELIDVFKEDTESEKFDE